MPLVLYMITQAQRCHPSFSVLDQAIIKGFYGKEKMHNWRANAEILEA